MAKKSYIDIGHGHSKVILWLYNTQEKRLYTWRNNTHEQVFGMDAMKAFRGRFDEKHGELSLIYPENWRYPGHVPTFIIEALERAFGPIEPTRFNPNGEAV